MRQYTVVALVVIVWGTLMFASSAGHKGDVNVVFERFPRQADLFREDVRPFVGQIIQKHGEKEWAIVVLTSEFHTHLGIYSIIGAKMGLRAREHFGVGLDELSVTSFAGRKPPVSCLNDGLQVSTGATLGHGTISVADDSPPAPKAIFTYGDAALCLRLKDEYWQIVRRDISRLVKKHGLDSHEYWTAVRRFGIQYWLEWSRDDIFDVRVTKGGT